MRSGSTSRMRTPNDARRRVTICSVHERTRTGSPFSISLESPIMRNHTHLTYKNALAVLGIDENATAKTVSSILGVLLVAISPAMPTTLSLLGPKDEITGL